MYCLSSAQNLQLHYEIGSYDDNGTTIERNYFKTRHEMFGADTLGLYYWNVDFEHDLENNGISFSTWTLLRSFSIPKFSSVHFVGGFSGIHGVSNSWYAGLLIPFAVGDFDLLPTLLYTYNSEAQKADVTAIIGWDEFYFKDRFQFNGFAYFFTYDKFDVNDSYQGKELAFSITPEFWYYIVPKLGLGGKVDFNYNIYTVKDGIEIFPSIAAKWNF